MQNPGLMADRHAAVPGLCRNAPRSRRGPGRRSSAGTDGVLGRPDRGGPGGNPYRAGSLGRLIAMVAVALTVTPDAGVGDGPEGSGHCGRRAAGAEQEAEVTAWQRAPASRSRAWRSASLRSSSWSRPAALGQLGTAPGVQGDRVGHHSACSGGSGSPQEAKILAAAGIKSDRFVVVGVPNRKPALSGLQEDHRQRWPSGSGSRWKVALAGSSSTGRRSAPWSPGTARRLKPTQCRSTGSDCCPDAEAQPAVSAASILSANSAARLLVLSRPSTTSPRRVGRAGHRHAEKTKASLEDRGQGGGDRRWRDVTGAGRAIDAASDQQPAFGGLESVFKKQSGPMKEWAEDQAKIGLESATDGCDAVRADGRTVEGDRRLGGGGRAEVAGPRRLGSMGLAATFGGTTADAVSALSSALKGDSIRWRSTASPSRPAMYRPDWPPRARTN